jgi:hypothetical protein
LSFKAPPKLRFAQIDFKFYHKCVLITNTYGK